MSEKKELTPELLEKVKSAMSAAELFALARENGVTMTAEEAVTYYAQIHPEEGELSDTELDDVAGGCSDTPKCPQCDSPDVNVSYYPFSCNKCGYVQVSKDL